MITAIEIETSTLRICCELIRKHRSLGIVDLVAYSNLPDGRIRKALTRGVSLGYLAEGPKPERVGKGNRSKTWIRTRKRLPGVIVLDEPEPIIDTLKPHRDWAVEALFGEYQGAAA